MSSLKDSCWLLIWSFECFVRLMATEPLASLLQTLVTFCAFSQALRLGLFLLQPFSAKLCQKSILCNWLLCGIFCQGSRLPTKDRPSPLQPLTSGSTQALPILGLACSWFCLRKDVTSKVFSAWLVWSFQICFPSRIFADPCFRKAQIPFHLVR